MTLSYELDPWYNINPQQVLGEHDVVWDDIRNTVEEASFPRFTESLDTLDQVMQQN